MEKYRSIHLLSYAILHGIVVFSFSQVFVYFSNTCLLCMVLFMASNSFKDFF